MFGFDEDEFPVQNLKQIESECLNLNITVPAFATPQSRLPVLVWVHGCVHLSHMFQPQPLFPPSPELEVAVAAQVVTGSLTAVHWYRVASYWENRSSS